MRSQNRLAPISFTLAALLSQLALPPTASAIPNPIDNGRGRKAEELPPEPATPPPDGNRTPGGGLGNQAACPEKPQKLTAITPLNAHGKSLSDAPTFWFYMPYTAAEVNGGEFSVLTPDEEQHIYHTELTLPDQPGLVSITIPASEATDLEPGQYYHWYLNLYCESANQSETNLNIDGWVQHLASTPDLEQQVEDSSPEIWYDAINDLAGQLQYACATTKSEHQQTWTTLLQAVELEHFSQTPFIGPVQ